MALKNDSSAFLLLARSPWDSVYEDYLPLIIFFSWFGISGFTKRLEGWERKEKMINVSPEHPPQVTSCSTSCELVHRRKHL